MKYKLSSFDYTHVCIQLMKLEYRNSISVRGEDHQELVALDYQHSLGMQAL